MNLRWTLDEGICWAKSTDLFLLVFLFELVVVLEELGIGILQLGQGVPVREHHNDQRPPRV